MPIPNTTRKRKSPQPPRKNTKVTGERSEASFLAQAAHRNFGVAKPWGDSRRYDFILDNGRTLHRIQVKCTEALRAQAYETRATYSVGKGRAVYTRQDVDFIAAHVVPLDIWYIIPVEICTPQPMLRFYPHREAKKMRLEKYREAWHLLEFKEDSPESKIEIHAHTDESIYAANLDADLNSGCHSERRRSDSDGKSRNLLFPATIQLPATAAPWPIPQLTILATRTGDQILTGPQK